MAQRFVFERKQYVALEEFTPAPLKSGEIRLRTVSSLMSTGTENICYNRNFAPGTHWDDWVKYPFLPGYLVVGEVIEIGEGVTGWEIGQMAATRRQHASIVTTVDWDCYPVPDGMSPADAGWFGLAFIGFFGARAAAYTIGDSVVIIGAGPIGQVSIRWASALGCQKVIVIDPVQGRLDLAKRGGATHLLPISVEGAADAIRKINGGELTELVMDCTGHPSVFDKALALPRDKGRVVLLGDAGDPSLQHLTPDVIRRGLTIVAAHMNHVDARWTYQAIFKYWVALWESGRYNLDGLNWHTFKPSQCAEAYTFANTNRPETMGIVFDWA